MVQITPGWATYLRVSDEDKQTPERSFAMQRQRIQERLLTPSSAPLFREYTDLFSGTNPNRKDYQQMLADAESGRFTHLGLYRSDRFGRNTIEGLQSATKLISLGVKIRVANMPSLRPEEPDGFFMFLIQMGMAQREVDVLAQRTSDGMEAKLRAGGWPGKAPEGYVNKERPLGSNKYERWVEASPEYIQPIREAWEMLLSDRYTLEQICEELTKRGYVRSSGRPWSWDDPKTCNRKTAKNRLQEIFHHPFYAGWAVSKRFDIKPGEVRGNWEPAISNAEYKRGIEILRKHDYNKSRQKRKLYLLRNLLWVQVGDKQYKMYGSTPSGRTQSYSYYITHARSLGSAVRVKTEIVDRQIEEWVAGVVISPDMVSRVREVYNSELNRFSQDNQSETLEKLKHRFAELQNEETRLGRLVITEQISNDAYIQLRSEWVEKIQLIQQQIEELELDTTNYVDDLDMALILMANISTLYQRLDKEQRTNFLLIFVKKIVVSPEGEIIGHELLSPFEYLSTLVNRFSVQEIEVGDGKQKLQGLRYGPLSEVEEFLTSLRFDSREKLKDLPLDVEN